MSRTHHDIIESEIRPLVSDGDWESPRPGEDHYSSNQMVAAFEAGVAKGVSGAEKLLMEKIEQNIVKAGVDTKGLISRLKALHIPLKSARLRVVSWDLYEVLVTLSPDVYVKESFDAAYNVVEELEDSTRNEHYSISFRFCPEVPGFDPQKATSDGFVMIHKSLMK